MICNKKTIYLIDSKKVIFIQSHSNLRGLQPFYRWYVQVTRQFRKTEYCYDKI